MRTLTAIESFQLLCKSTGQWGLYISFNDWNLDESEYIIEAEKAAPYLDFDQHEQIIMDGRGIILGDKAEIEKLFSLTVGDDGPTKSNPYTGPMRVYALTCDSTGALSNENT